MALHAGSDTKGPDKNNMPNAHPGDNAGVNIKGPGKNNIPRSGCHGNGVQQGGGDGTLPRGRSINSFFCETGDGHKTKGGRVDTLYTFFSGIG